MLKLAFYKGQKRFVNFAISKATGGPYSHVEVIIKELGNGFYLCLSSSMMDGGVRIKVICLQTEDWEIVNSGIAGVYESDAWEWFYKYHRCTYDYYGALRHKLHWLDEVEDKFYCSEVVCHLFKLEHPQLNPNQLYKHIKALVV